MSELPTDDRYLTAIMAHGNDLIPFQLPVLHLTMLVASLHLALRHPQYPPRMRPYVEAFLEATIARLETIDPVLATVARAGMDPDQDVPRP